MEQDLKRKRLLLDSQHQKEVEATNVALIKEKEKVNLWLS